MLELAASALGGGALGGILRLVPEVLRVFTAKADRDHEFRMAQLTMEASQRENAGRIEELRARSETVLDEGAMKALVEAVKGQSTPTGHFWVDIISQTVRPVVTYWWMWLFTLHKLATVYTLAVVQGTGWVTAMEMSWGPQEFTILSAILNFWFLDRVLKHRPLN